MLKKLAAVIGTRMAIIDVEQVDPDPSYVITWDNLLKMLAILMRLRSVQDRHTNSIDQHNSQINFNLQCMKCGIWMCDIISIDLHSKHAQNGNGIYPISFVKFSCLCDDVYYTRKGLLALHAL